MSPSRPVPSGPRSARARPRARARAVAVERSADLRTAGAFASVRTKSESLSVRARRRAAPKPSVRRHRGSRSRARRGAERGTRAPPRSGEELYSSRVVAPGQGSQPPMSAAASSSRSTLSSTSSAGGATKGGGRRQHRILSRRLDGAERDARVLSVGAGRHIRRGAPRSPPRRRDRDESGIGLDRRHARSHCAARVLLDRPGEACRALRERSRRKRRRLRPATAATSSSFHTTRRLEQRGVLLGAGEALDAEARRESRRCEPVFRLRWQRHCLPQPAREVAAQADAVAAHHRDCVLEMVDHAVDPAAPARSRSDGASARTALPRRRWPAAGRRRGCATCRTRPGSRRAAEHRRSGDSRISAKAPRRVGEVEDHTAPRGGRRSRPSRERPPPPRRRRPRTRSAGSRSALPSARRGVEDVRGPRLDSEALDSLEGRHEPDPLARLDLGRGRRRSRPVRRGRRSRGLPGETMRPARAPPQRPLRLHRDVDIHGADLQADLRARGAGATCARRRPPRPGAARDTRAP